jgi:hypothetical protein
MAALTVTLREAGAERTLRMPLPEDKGALASAIFAFAAQHLASPPEHGCFFHASVPDLRQLSADRAVGACSRVTRSRNSDEKLLTLTREVLDLDALPGDLEQGCARSPCARMPDAAARPACKATPPDTRVACSSPSGLSASSSRSSTCR